MRRVTLFFALLLLSAILSAQTQMEQWNTHFAYNSVDALAQSDTRVYGLSDGALYSVDKRDETVEYYSKMTGLNGTNIAAIEYDEYDRCLVIAYADGNIDIMTDAGVENISDFYNKQMTASKTANSIYCHQGRAYLCCPFGIVVINVKKREIAETYYIGPNAEAVDVNSLTICSGNIYAATSSTIYKASLSAQNLMNFENWHQLSALPGDGDIQKIASLNGHLWLWRNNLIYQKQVSDTVWSTPLQNWGAYGMQATSSAIIVGHGGGFSVTTDGLNCSTSWSVPCEILNAQKDSQGNYWIAAGSEGLMQLHSDGTYNKYAPNGPLTNSAYFMKFFGDVLYATNGHYFAVKSETHSNVLVCRDGQWEGISWPKLLQDAASLDPNCIEANDADGVAVDPLDANHFYVTSLGSGLYEYRYQNGQYVIQNYFAAGNHNGEKVEVAADIPTELYKYSWTDAPVFDAAGNLFFSNLLAHNPIKVVSQQGAWTNYANATLLSGERIFNLFFDRQNPNYLWYCDKRIHAGIGVIDTKGTPYDTSDDLIRFYHQMTDQNNNQITFTEVYCATQDLQGNIWMATDLGPVILGNTQNVFSGGMTCTRNIIPRLDGSGLGDYLLDGVKINCIAVDGGNRKWIGTANNGLYLFDDTGMMEIKHFTTSNTPLVSNTILSLAIKPSSGELFIGTGNGILSYQSDASDASDDMGDLYAYPNPVRPDYGGLVTIKGLVDDASVRITDAVGNVVCMTRSNGGIAVWDGRNGAGHRVGSGVYYAICVSSDGSVHGRTRILVLK